MDIEKELLSAAKLKLKKGEDRQSFLVRLMKTISKLDNDPWAELSTESQDWTNNAALAFNEGRALQDFVEEEGDEVEDLPEQEVSLVPGGERGEVFEEIQPQDEVGPIEDNEEAPSAPVRGRAGSKRNSACHMIKTWVVKNPKISVKDIAAKLRSKDMKVSDVTIASLRSSVRDTLRVMRDLNMIDVKLQ
jgi:hypothetical protein